MRFLWQAYENGYQSHEANGLEGLDQEQVEQLKVEESVVSPFQISLYNPLKISFHSNPIFPVGWGKFWEDKERAKGSQNTTRG